MKSIIVLLIVVSNTLGWFPDDPEFVDVCIDPGHGGIQPGATQSYWYNGEELYLEEKDLCLFVAYEGPENIIDLFVLDLTEDWYITATRISDHNVSLEDRVKIANGKKRDALNNWLSKCFQFISIHHNASDYETGCGIEIYWSDKREGGQTLDEDEIDDNIGWAEDVVHAIQNSLNTTYYNHELITHSPYEGNLRDGGVKQEDFYVLRNLWKEDDKVCYGVLTESGFVTNTVYEDEEFFWLYFGLNDAWSCYFLGNEAGAIAQSTKDWILERNRKYDPIGEYREVK